MIPQGPTKIQGMRLAHSGVEEARTLVERHSLKEIVVLQYFVVAPVCVAAVLFVGP